MPTTDIYYIYYKAGSSNQPIKLSWRIGNQMASAIEIYKDFSIMFPSSNVDQDLAVASSGTVTLGNAMLLKHTIHDVYIAYLNILEDNEDVTTTITLKGGEKDYNNSGETWEMLKVSDSKKILLRIIIQ